MEKLLIGIATLIVCLSVDGQPYKYDYVHSDMVIIINNRPCIYQRVYFVKYRKDQPLDSLDCLYTPGDLRIKKDDLESFRLLESDSTLMVINYHDPEVPNSFAIYTYNTVIEIIENDYNVFNFMNVEYLDRFIHKKKPRSGYLLEFWIGQIHSVEPKHLRWN